jgi:hypothetical protein
MRGQCSRAIAGRFAAERPCWDGAGHTPTVIAGQCARGWPTPRGRLQDRSDQLNYETNMLYRAARCGSGHDRTGIAVGRRCPDVSRACARPPRAPVAGNRWSTFHDPIDGSQWERRASAACEVGLPPERERQSTSCRWDYYSANRQRAAAAPRHSENARELRASP